MSDEGAEQITLDELLEMAMNARLLETHVSMPATVVSYNASAATVTLSLPMNRMFPDGNGNYISEPLPNIQDVPISWPRCKQFAITFPLAPGDRGHIIVCDSNIGSWRVANQEPVDPGDLGTHGLDGAVFVPGLNNDSNGPVGADANNMRIGLDSTTGGTIDFTPGGDVKALAKPTKNITIDVTTSGSAAVIVNGGTLKVASETDTAGPYPITILNPVTRNFKTL